MDLSETQLIESVFAGGGEMGARCVPSTGRRLCWARDALAAIAASLRAHRAGLRVSDAHFLGPGLHDALQRCLRGGRRN